jgi:predicted 2-oxoglutarate/Fe(II)-dependent dioxygenase YbiX
MIPIQRALRVANKTFINNYEFTYNHFEIKRLFGNVMYEGAENEPHDDDGDVYPGKTHIEEHYSAILMLNSEYTGGELFFEHKGVEVRLEAGDLIMFRGNAENLHGVRKVLSGKRINVIIFFRNFDLEQPYDSDIWKDFIES